MFNHPFKHHMKHHMRHHMAAHGWDPEGWDFASRRGYRRWGPFEFEWEAGSPERGGRGRRGRINRGDLRLVLLALIAEQPRHGYELIKAIEELTGGHYAPSPGMVYPTLSLLLDEGAVEEAVDDSPRKAFAATEAGRAELAERAEEAEALLSRLRAMGEEGERHRAPPIGRAVANLFTALKGRAQEGFDDDTVHRIAEILDEAARKIERL